MINTRLAVPIVLLCAAPITVAAQAIEHKLFPERKYDSKVPAPAATLGYELGQHIATYDKIIPYFRALAASSSRVLFETHGESYEGRPIFHVVITSPENQARLAQIKDGLARLADPRRTPQRELDAIVGSTPVALMMVFGTDGAETAGPEAAIHLAYQLAAATDAQTGALLRDAVVIIVPAENPDANQRAVAWYNAFRVGSADPDAAEHQFPWGINSNNHYQNDPNRESVWNILRESQAMVALYRTWNPQVYVDNHGEHAQYTGPWYVEPLHEVLTPTQRAWHRKFGEAMQPEFQRRGYVYAPWEFGQFDPGYWDTYPNFTGAIAWTTETTGGGSRGLRMERRGGAPYTLADGAIQHVVAADVTLKLAVAHREQILRDYLAYKRSAIDEGTRSRIKAYAISARNDPATVATVVDIMLRNGIDVMKTTDDLRMGDLELPSGSIVLPTAQPQGRLLKVLMEREARMSPEFLSQIERARADGNRANRIFYDITAWSIPHTYNLESYELTVPVPGLAPVTESVRPSSIVLDGDARAGYTFDFHSNAALTLIGRLRRDSINYRRDTAGNIQVLRTDNPNRDFDRGFLRSLMRDSGMRLTARDQIDTTGTVLHKPGRIAVVMDRPVSPASYGHVWYTFEQRYGFEFTPLNFERLAQVNLDKYATLILPDGNYASAPRAAEVAARLRAWVDKGGTLIGLRGGSAWIATPEHQLTAARLRAPARQPMPAIPGAIFSAKVTPHPLLAGYSQAELPVMVWSALAFDPAAPVEKPLLIGDRLSGYAFPESLAHVAGTSYVVRDRRGSGNVVLFLDDPNFRLFWDGLTRLFFNAVLMGDQQ